ncbi:hypothetical protein THARTR1_05719 [Trichoderma harzianum]|uniref:Uncharacterized protein n=1 Tax=Trichoderma harzianum TaxID=5544 RepID=A0A2K0U802_TRIHA|nr:hypothetical protein THARTR1_05719 [Trichoderma harzianum]
MPSEKKKNDTQKEVIMLSYKDLQVKKGDPEWEDGIKCIKAYQSQATVLSLADQEEMRYLIQRLDYVIPPSAKKAPSSHKLMRAHKKSVQQGEAPSWPIFIILKTLYNRNLPEKYIHCIRGTFNTTVLSDHTEEYFAIDSTEPAEPAATEEDHPKSPWKDKVPGNKAKISKETKKRDASAFGIQDGSSSAIKRIKMMGAGNLFLPVTETNNQGRRDSFAPHAQLANAVSEQQTAKEGRYKRTIEKVKEMIDKKLEAMQDALEKKIEEKFAAAQEDLERKEKEKSEVQTKELQSVMSEAVKLHGEAVMRLAEIAWQRPAAPQDADV